MGKMISTESDGSARWVISRLETHIKSKTMVKYLRVCLLIYWPLAADNLVIAAFGRVLIIRDCHGRSLDEYNVSSFKDIARFSGNTMYLNPKTISFCLCLRRTNRIIVTLSRQHNLLLIAGRKTKTQTF